MTNGLKHSSINGWLIALVLDCNKAEIKKQVVRSIHFSFMGERMKKLLPILIVLCTTIAYPQAYLYELSDNIETYKNKQITMILKLKRYDTVFQVITFYDNKNHDITFDCLSLVKQPWFIQQRLNLHPGMAYRVTFTVKGVGNLKEVIADLDYFEPAILQKLP